MLFQLKPFPDAILTIVILNLLNTFETVAITFRAVIDLEIIDYSPKILLRLQKINGDRERCAQNHKAIDR